MEWHIQFVSPCSCLSPSKVNDFACSCPNGFTGKRCETKVDLCANDPCVRGMCVDKLFK